MGTNSLDTVETMGSSSFFGPLDDLEQGERALAARALRAVRPKLASVLVDVGCHLKGLAQLEKAEGLPQCSTKVVSKVGQSASAGHYGLDRGGGNITPRAGGGTGAALECGGLQAEDGRVARWRGWRA